MRLKPDTPIPIPLIIFRACKSKNIALAIYYHPMRRKTASANALETTISSRVDPEYLPSKAFSRSIGGGHGNFG